MSIRVTHVVTLHPGAEEAFLSAYEGVRSLVHSGRFAGHVNHELCRAIEGGDRWMITSVWESEADYDTWEQDPDHRSAIAPLRPLFAEAARPVRYDIEIEDVS